MNCLQRKVNYIRDIISLPRRGLFVPVGCSGRAHIFFFILPAGASAKEREGCYAMARIFRHNCLERSLVISHTRFV